MEIIVTKEDSVEIAMHDSLVMSHVQEFQEYVSSLFPHTNWISLQKVLKQALYEISPQSEFPPDQETLDHLLRSLHAVSNKNMKIHGFAVHNQHTKPFDLNYAIETSNSFSMHRREHKLAGFSPHSPIRLIDRTPWLTPEGSVLFNDGRIEFLLSVNQL